MTWVLTDGKAGDELQALSVTEALGLSAEVRRVRPRAPFTWLMPWLCSLEAAATSATSSSTLRIFSTISCRLLATVLEIWTPCAVLV